MKSQFILLIKITILFTSLVFTSACTTLSQPKVTDNQSTTINNQKMSGLSDIESPSKS